MNTRPVWHVWLLAILLSVGCNGNEGRGVTGPDTTPADIVHEDIASSSDSVQAPPEILSDSNGTMDFGEAETPDDDICQPHGCELGAVECKYNNKAERVCVEVEGIYEWSVLKECDDWQACQEGLGCTCEYGACAEGDDLDSVCSGKILGDCQSWTCEKGCCGIDSGPMIWPCCDCSDCIDLESGETSPCPGTVPEGAILNLCTTDLCDCDCQCSYVEKSCNDDDQCTADSCNPETGECIFEPKTTYCFGASPEEADGKCSYSDNNLCTVELCDIEGEFIPWASPDEPEFDCGCDDGSPDWPNCTSPPEGVYKCKHVDKLSLGLCDDYDCGTVDSCDPELGCVHGFDFDELPPCDSDEQCVDGDICTMEYCALDCEGCQYPQIDCDDGDICTTGDYCDPELGGCVNNLKNCKDGDPCTLDFCDPDTGDCVNEEGGC
jgi:hypothetical protein